MSHRVKAWLSSIRRTTSSSSFDENESDNEYCDDSYTPFDTVASDVIQYILSFLHYSELHSIRLIGKEWNYLCDIEQKTLSLNPKTPTEHIKYWMLKLRNIRIANLSKNANIDNQFLLWLKKEYFPFKIKQKQKQRTFSESSNYSNDSSLSISDCDSDIQLNIHIDLSFCFGIDCVEEPQVFGRGAVHGHNDYLKKVINQYTQYGCTFNIFGNHRLINPSVTLQPKHVVLLQLEALKHNEVQHCFKFASPANRQFTGPFRRFERMIKNGYPMLIQWECIRVHALGQYIDDSDNPLHEKKRHFIVRIEKNGKDCKFKWTLSKQTLEPYYQCWMTDSVASLFSR